VRRLGRGLTLRGLWDRRALSLVVLVVTVIPVATAAIGPIFAGAARTVLARSALEGAAPEDRGWRFTSSGGDVATPAREFASGVPFLHPPIEGGELISPELKSRANYPLMWQDGQCEHVTLLEGRCPGEAKEIMVSTASGFPLGARLRVGGVNELPEPGVEPRAAALRVVGVYRPTEVNDPFWFGRNLFAQTAGALDSVGDPLFTVKETKSLTSPPAGVDWTNFAILAIDGAKVTGADLPRLEELQRRSDHLSSLGAPIIVYTGVSDTLAELRTHTGALGVPAMLVIAQLVGLGWLLLYLTVSDLVTARGPEIALARLRGHGRLRVWRFGLAEPVILLAVALVAGLALARQGAQFMADSLLSVEVNVGLPAEAALAGAAVPLGGVVAAAIAARNFTVRPVTEEWRRTPRRRARSWVLDAVVLAVTGIGLIELLAAGVITETSGQQASALAVPGLMAVAAALLACRVVPFLARRLFGVTRRAGGIGAFLALRQIARGPATAGTLVVLVTAFGMATFATAAWSVTSANFERVARTHNGADTVLKVRPEGVAAFRKAVERADPSGVRAAPVLVLPGPPKTLATDPARFAHVANWERSPGTPSPGELTAMLRAGAAPRVLLTGDRIRLHVDPIKPPNGWQVRLYLDIRVPGDVRPRALPLGAPDRAVMEWGLPPGCRTGACELRGIRGDVSFVPGVSLEDRQISVEATRIEVRDGNRWREADAGLTDPARWHGTGVVTEDGLRMRLSTFGGFKMTPATFPEELPVLVNGPLNGGFSPGADQAYLARQKAVATIAALPGLDVPGAVVDLELADRVAYTVDPKADYQVWVAPGHARSVREGLVAQGIPVFEPRRVSDLVAGYTVQGPGLALILLLTAAAAAAALALGRAVLALYGAARRRGYELAALEAAGARAGALRAALLLEQLITLGAGTLAGVAAGVLAARAALPHVPQFAEHPITPPLLYEPSMAPVAAVAGAALLIALIAASVTAEILLRGIRVEHLRQAPG
jgi:hypothetical protein